MSARGPRKQYGHLGLAGLVQRTRARSTGTEVGLYASAQAEMETDPELPWCTVCEEHGSIVCQETLYSAQRSAPHPEEWCDECRDALEAEVVAELDARDAAEAEEFGEALREETAEGKP